MRYIIMRSGIEIGEKCVAIEKYKEFLMVNIDVYLGKEKRRISALNDANGNLISFKLEKDGIIRKYNQNNQKSIMMKELFQVDEVLLTLYGKSNRKSKDYYVLSTENSDFYRIRFIEKGERKYNILVPTYCYLEYGDDGYLEYMEDFRGYLQIMRYE